MFAMPVMKKTSVGMSITAKDGKKMLIMSAKGNAMR
jgi:hypothetical protein